nr:glycine, alanine and asparagine-rich protein-like [Penaeus vannamei]
MERNGFGASGNGFGASGSGFGGSSNGYGYGQDDEVAALAESIPGGGVPAESFYSVNELIGVVPDAGYAYGAAVNGNGANGNGVNGSGSNGYGSNGNGIAGNGNGSGSKVNGINGNGSNGSNSNGNGISGNGNGSGSNGVSNVPHDAYELIVGNCYFTLISKIALIQGRIQKGKKYDHACKCDKISANNERQIIRRIRSNGFGAAGNGPSNGYGYGQDDEVAALAESIPGGGVPGEDYPILASVPDTGFSCDAQAVQGYYADTAAEAGCQVFHICQDRALRRQQDSFLCPNGTIFNQQYLVCDWWFNVDCSQAESFYSVNELIGVVPDAGYAYGAAVNGNGNGSNGRNGNGANGNGRKNGNGANGNGVNGSGSNGYGSNGNGIAGNGNGSGSNGNGVNGNGSNGNGVSNGNGNGSPVAPSTSYGAPF